MDILKCINKSKRIVTIVIVATVLPLFCYAQQITFSGVVQKILDLINPLLALITGLALVVFTWGIVKYIYRAGEEKNEGHKVIIYGIIGLFVLFSFWGIIKIMKDTLFS